MRVRLSAELAVVHMHVLQSLEAKTTYVAHSGVIEDVAWHQHHTDIFGSVGDDKQLILWDTRKPPRDGEGQGWTVCKGAGSPPVHCNENQQITAQGKALLL